MPNDVNITISAKDQASKIIKGVYTEIGGLNKQIKQEDQEWQKLSLSIDKAKEPVRYYTEYTKHLEAQLGSLAQKEKLLKGAIEQSKNAKGEDTKQTEKLRTQLSALELQEARARNQIDKNTVALNENTGGIKKQILQLKEHSMHMQMSMMTLMMASTAAFATITLGLKDTVKESNELKNSLIGLNSVAEGTGQGMGAAKEAALSLADDGLMAVSDAATSLKNLLMRGFSLPEAIDIMNRFKDSAAFGRQSALSFGESIRGATEGLKNENSILVDNAGVTKNVSMMWKDYAAQIGKGVKSLTTAEKRQAEYNGIMQETRFQVGDAAKLTETFAGQQAKAAAQTKLMKAAIGEALEPTLAGLLKSLTPVVTGLKSWTEDNPQFVSTVILATFALTGLVAILSTLAFTLPGIVTGLQILAGPIGWVTLAIGLLTGGLTYFIAKAAIARGELEKQRQESEKLAKQKLEERKKIVDLAAQYDVLTNKLSKTKKGSADYKILSDQLNKTKQTLKEIMPGVIDGYDKESKTLIINTEKLKENAEAARKNIAARHLEESGQAMRKLIDAQNELAKFSGMKNKLEISVAIAGGSLSTVTREQERLNKEVETAQAEYGKVTEKIKEEDEAVRNAAKSAKEFVDGLTTTKDKAKDTTEKVDKLKEATDALSRSGEIIRAEFELAQAQMKENASESDKLTTKLAFLRAELQNSKDIVSSLQARYNGLKKAKKENTEEGQELLLQTINEQTGMTNLENQIKETEKALKDLSIVSINHNDILGRIQYSYDMATAKLSGMISPAEELALKQEMLTDKLTVQEAKVRALQAEYDKLAKTKGIASKEAMDLTDKIQAEQLAQANLGKELRETNEAIEDQSKLLDDYSDKVEKTKTKYLDALAKAEEDYNKKVAQANSDLAKSEQQLTDEYNQQFKSRTSALTDWVGLFDEIPEKAKISGQKLMANLQGQVDAFENWQDLIAKLSAKGIDEGLIAELREMGPKASSELAALNELTDKELSDYVALWKEKNKLAREQSVKELAPLAAETSAKINELRVANGVELGKLKDDWDEAIADIKDNTLAELTSMVNEAEKQGADFVTKLAAAITSKIPDLDKAIGEVVSSLEVFTQPRSETEVQGVLSETNTAMGNAKNEITGNILPINQGILYYKEQVASGNMTAADAGTKADALRDLAARMGIPADMILGNIPIEAARQFVQNLPRLAEGGNVKQGGLAVTGEEGPELLNLPQGAQVTPLDKPQGGLGTTINITITGNKIANDMDIRHIAEELIREIRRKTGWAF